MKNLRLLIFVIVLMVGAFLVPTLTYAQQTWETRLAGRFAGAVLAIQQACIEVAKVECELLQIDQNPPVLLQGQVCGYVGIRQRGVLYFYLVVAETDDMIPEIYLFDSQNRLLSSGTMKEGGGNLASHKPEYTQKVFERIRMFKGSGHIGIGVLAPVGSN